ncbi:RNA 2',3'-cyclic phosphodiesterase [Rhodoblastus acidophilus]|uniref:RNA 2',3'-cyclic phosphodiesterase n=1 Tax=Candidatus Rhodoblastus alkanivorans TaxID=2954117 RepID=A0ABS9Z133_9HYPH|nr:RNA 2',3'-cyclic phosphodiesterase [Candidatus Rhodoblastus alkanivorans]MCI4678556.1 RNA 2',3'-cyclic phosphodiesterase [Candidatus Rhodoblastus alkanivorans]MCI4681356.1 RNA 2',3'-cyclic phosphodiesterase [Candidatus Rhodoblastus alkanivorans]MDI4642404.1 RNA 2',3'-cyclic phosphodiesterase [Rhodoblastus acidophilus]
MPRLFTAFEIPSQIAAQLAFFRGGLHGARWMEPQDYHVTLRFFGDIDARVAEALAADLAETESFSGGAPLRLELDEIGVFGGRSPRALYARVKADPLLTRLQAAHEAIARRNGLPPETRKFAPHVTLARLRGVSSGAAGVWLAERAFPLGLAFEAARFALFSSRDSVGGGPYRLEAVYPFG